MQHPDVTRIRLHGLPEAEAFAYDYFNREIYTDEVYYNFNGDLVHEENLIDYLTDILGVDKEIAP